SRTFARRAEVAPTRCEAATTVASRVTDPASADRARRQRAGCLLASGAAGRLPLVVGIVSAAGVVIREPQLLVLLVFHLEIRRLQHAQQPPTALDRVAAGLLEPVPYRVAAVIVNDFPAGRVTPASGGRPRLPGNRQVLSLRLRPVSLSQSHTALPR